MYVHTISVQTGINIMQSGNIPNFITYKEEESYCEAEINKPGRLKHIFLERTQL